MSSIVSVSREMGGGFVGKGCVGQASSPGTSLFGTGRSSMGHNGSPVTRLNTKSSPDFEGTATISTILPLCRTVTSFGSVHRSRSQRSW